MRRWLSLIAVVVWLLPTSITSAAMLVHSFDQTTQDRFYVGPDKAFIGGSYDWSGVGRSGSSRWATMISPYYFVSANHYKPGVNDTVYFYYANDPNGGYETRTVESGVQIPNSDVWLGRLSAPVSSNVKQYSILDLPSESNYDNRLIYTFGLSDKSPPERNVRLGFNRIDVGSYVDNFQGTIGRSYHFTDNYPGLGANESYLQPGDSGGPSLTIYSGVPTLVGIHYYISGDVSPRFSGDTFVPHYIADIQANKLSEVPVYWTGNSGTTWNAATGLNNWKDSGGVTASYGNGIAVTFDDTANGLTADISVANVSSSSVVFDNTTKNFVVTGSKGITGATGILKQGAGKVTLNCVNAYTGVTTVDAFGDMFSGGVPGTLELGLLAQAPVLTGAGGADIRGGKLVFDYTGTGDDPAAIIASLLDSGYDTGWAAGQIRNSTAGTRGLTLGWMNDTTAMQVTVMSTYEGDANLDGAVNGLDFDIWKANVGTNTGANWAMADFNYDGAVNGLDLDLWRRPVGSSLGGGVVGALGMPVPEPGTLALLLPVAVWFGYLVRRRPKIQFRVRSHSGVLPE